MRLRETLIFITPKPPMAVTISKQGWKLRLFLKRKSDQLVSHKIFRFHFVPHENILLSCNNCYEGPDKLIPSKTCAGPGIKRRIMDRDIEDINEDLEKGNVKKYPSPSCVYNESGTQCVKNMAKSVVLTTLFPIHDVTDGPC